MRRPFIIAALMFVTLTASQSCFAQAASVFVKEEPYQCWLDVKQVVLRHSNAIFENEKDRTIGAKHMSILAGDYQVSIQVSQEKVKDEIECRISVVSRQWKTDAVDNSSGGGVRRSPDLPADLLIADQIASEVKKLKKNREKH